MNIAILENPEIRNRSLPITVEAYHSLGKQGLISEKSELLEGVVVQKVPKEPVHSSVVSKLYRILSKKISEKFIVRQENPISLERSEPEPDISIVDWEATDYLHFHPTFAHFIIEVANTTLKSDREKALIYSKANIPEYWIINLISMEVEIFKEPGPTGYRQMRIATKEEYISPFILSNWNFRLSEYI